MFSWVATALFMVGVVLAAQTREQAPDQPQRDGPDDGSGGGAVRLTPAQESHGLQVARARERGRGRQAASPLQIPRAGWKDIMWRVYAGISKHRVLAIAAGVVFYSLLALFPAITAGVSVYAMFANAQTLADNMARLSSFMPGGAIDIVSQQIKRISAHGGEALTVGFIAGLVVALWSANAGMKAIFDALNVIYDEAEHRSFIKLNLVSMAFTIASIGLMLVMVASIVIVPLVLAQIGFANIGSVVVKYGRWPVMFIVGIFALAILYRFGPSRAFARWRWLSLGSILASAGWIVMSIAFSWYVANFGSYNATYGSLGAAVGMMMWMWLSIIVVLIGAELNAEMEHQTARDSTTGAPLPLGERGAVMADTVGAAQ